jgi:putative hydroxymethylpyrimidine transport system substrate-binding protein
LRNRARRSRACVLLALTACCASLTACGTKQDTVTAPSAKRFSVMLDFFPNADHAALYSAISHGNFRAVGLDVQPQAPADPSEPLKLLAAGRVDMAISYEPELLLARDQGLKVVSIGALVQRPLTSIIALPASHVSKVADLAGKTVGTAGIAYQTAELQTALQSAGVSPSRVRQVNVGFDLVPAMVSGRVAATLGGFWNYEAIQLQRMHKQPLTIPVDRAGVPAYDELVLVVREQQAHSDGPARVLAGAHPGSAPGALEPGRGSGPGREGQPLARRGPAAGLDPAHAARDAAAGHGQALRLAGSHRVGLVLQLDVHAPAAGAPAQRGAAAVYERVPCRPGNMSAPSATWRRCG